MVYRLIWSCYLLIFLLIACQAPKAPEDEKATLFQRQQSRQYVQTTRINVEVGPEQISLGSSPEEILWSRAEKLGMAEIMNVWLGQRLLLQPAREQVFDVDTSSFLLRQGQFEPEQEQMTRSYAQEFKLNSMLVPVEQVGGRVVNIEDQYSMAGQFQQVTIELFDLEPDENGAYFVTGRKKEDLDSEVLQILGSGKIYHVLNGTAQASLMETKREVRTGDYIFMLQSEVEPAEKPVVRMPEYVEVPLKEEVVVEPETKEPEPDFVPKGSK